MRHRPKLTKHRSAFLSDKGWTALFLGGWAVTMVFLAARAISADHSGHIYAAPINVWGDWCAHFTMGSAMAFRELFPSASPFLIGAPFHYPYLVNFLSALLIRAGVPFFAAFQGTSAVLLVGCVGALFYFYRALLGSAGAARWASALFLLSGGVGFLFAFHHAAASDQFWSAFFHYPLADAKDPANGIIWGSVIQSFLLPQRALQLGLPMALGVLTLMMGFNRDHPAAPSWERVAPAAVLMGLLPWAHAHSFAALLVILPFWMGAALLNARPKSRRTFLVRWAGFAGLSAALAGLLVWILFLKGEAGPRFLQWKPGWYAESVGGWFVFWIKNWGVSPFAAMAGAVLWLWNKPHDHRRGALLMGIPFLVLFALLNLIQFQPWMWDNTKILLWISVGVSGWAGYFVSKIWTGPRRSRRWIGIALFAVMSFSGLMDAVRVIASSSNPARLFSREDVELARWVRANTGPHAVWITSPHHNNWLYTLAGRRVLMTYEGWLWSHGYDYGTVKSDLETMLADPGREDLRKQYHVTHVAVGPEELRLSGGAAHAYNQACQEIHRTENTQLFSCAPTE